jgi:CO/xanthine dehydrogenase Mo-binding subunit
MVVGGLLERCAKRMLEQLAGASPAEHHAKHGRLHVEEQYQAPEGRQWSDKTYRGDAYATYSWGCDVAEVELDPVTHEARVTKFLAVQEFGRPIHPAMAQGQIEGASAQGIGWALLEEVVMRDGHMANPQLTNYVIPTTLDTPPMEVVMLENPYSGGPFGAKGVGEMPIDGPAPAVVNAIRHAGLDARHPPERLMRAPAHAPRGAAR